MPSACTHSGSTVVQNIGAFLVPVSAAIAHILLHRSGGTSAAQVQDYVSHTLRLFGDDGGAAAAAVELSHMLCVQCSLAQLFFIVSALINEVRSAAARAGQHTNNALASSYYSALLCTIETCVPLQAMLIGAVKQQLLQLSDAETEGLGEFLSACGCIEFSAAAVAADPALGARATALLLSLQEGYMALMKECPALKRQLLLSVALVAIK